MAFRLPVRLPAAFADDRELLARFAEARDERAFAAVVGRHARILRPRFGPTRRGHSWSMTAVYVIAIASAVVGTVVMFALFIWAARKDGEEDRELQRRLGIRRSTRLGR